ncbi:MAG TPA: TIGR01777 family oxidoreductase [Dermatophilaceae bacterium]|nr:TIGR01777 family oxidoreductase [Dermatophilaceae bacterium]
MPKRVAITGASGFIGSALSTHLRGRGDEVLHLVRRPAGSQRNPREVSWDPAAGTLDPADLAGVDALVHLAGAGVADHRWTPSYKQQIFASRVDGTTTVASALAQLGDPRAALVVASGIDVYGADRGEEPLTEQSEPGEGFLADVVRAWEAAAGPARAAGLRVAHARTGLVLGPGGGSLARMLPLARLGLGGPLGSGRQWWSWITLQDTVRAYAHLVDHSGVAGPVNLVSPAPARQRDLAKALGAALHRPAVLPAPAAALRLYLGEFASAVLGSKNISPTVLTGSGFAWEHPDLQTAVRWVVDQG